LSVGYRQEGLKRIEPVQEGPRRELPHTAAEDLLELVSRTHDGVIITLRSNLRRCSDAFEIRCWSGERVQWGLRPGSLEQRRGAGLCTERRATSRREHRPALE
jgi:hypothetical protein